MGWIETEIGMLSTLEAAHKQACNNQERGRACHLRCDQHGAGALAAAGDATSTFMQGVAERSGGDTQCGKDTHDCGRQHGDTECEEENAKVEGEFENDRHYGGD